MEFTKEQIAKMIDHSLLEPDVTKDDIAKLCEEAKHYGFNSVAVNPCYVSYATELLKGTDVKVLAGIGFPLGATTTEVKAFETKNAVENGAQEVDMVINVGALKSGDYELVKRDIEAFVKASGDAINKVIIETGLLTNEEKVIACKLAKEAGADYVKSSTGFNMIYTFPRASEVTTHDIKLMRKTVGKDMGVKASGWFTFETAMAMIEAGANRIGTGRVNALAIMEGFDRCYKIFKEK